jgi:cell division topological specificity factor
MSLFDLFRSRKSNSAAIAKERLQILVAHDRRAGGPSYLPQLKHDLLKVIRKYVAVESDAVSVNVDRDGNREVLELNVVLPD